LAELARESAASSGHDGRTWKRNDIYADRLDRDLSVHESE